VGKKKMKFEVEPILFEDMLGRNI
jgi:hypothetical protein